MESARYSSRGGHQEFATCDVAHSRRLMVMLSLQQDERRARTRAGTVGRLGLISFAGTLVVLLAAVSSVLGQPQNPPGDTTYTRAPVFQIPFQPESGERRLKEVQLFVSTDLGQTWKQA